jgi:hypothetical protein
VTLKNVGEREDCMYMLSCEHLKHDAKPILQFVVSARPETPILFVTLLGSILNLVFLNEH